MVIMPGERIRCTKTNQEYIFRGYTSCERLGSTGEYCQNECNGMFSVINPDYGNNKVLSKCFYYMTSGLSIVKVEESKSKESDKNEWDDYYSAKSRRGICLRQ